MALYYYICACVVSTGLPALAEHLPVLTSYARMLLEHLPASPSTALLASANKFLRQVRSHTHTRAHARAHQLNSPRTSILAHYCSLFWRAGPMLMKAHVGCGVRSAVTDETQTCRLTRGVLSSAVPCGCCSGPQCMLWCLKHLRLVRAATKASPYGQQLASAARSWHLVFFYLYGMYYHVA